MKNIAPEIFRQRLLIEGFFRSEIDREKLASYMLGVAAELDLKAYGDPIIFSPASGMGKEENQGFDGFLPLIDSGISAYIWSKSRFFSVVIYTCKGFDADKAIRFTSDFFAAEGEVVSCSF